MHGFFIQISADYFAGAQNLNYLMLHFNQLTSASLGPGSLTFTGNSDDMYLDLAWNMLSEGVSPAAFGGQLSVSHSNATIKYTGTPLI